MNTEYKQTATLEGLRVILAIAAKDSLDAVRNRTLLSVLVAVVLMVALFRVLPAFREENTLTLVVVDPGHSAAVDGWAERGPFNLVRTASRQEMEDFLGGEETAVLGLVLPPDLDRQVQGKGQAPLALEGYVDHWVRDAQADELGATAEAQLTALTGRPVRIEVHNEEVFTHPRGLRPVTTSFLLVYALVVVGLMVAPNLMVEEKELKTMEALLISPASAGQIVVAKALTGLLYCLLAGGLVLIASARMVVHWDLAILAVLGGSLFTVSVGLLLGVVLNARQQLIIWSSVLMIPLFLPVIASEVLADLQVSDLVVRAVALVPTVPVAEATRWALSGQVPWAEAGWGLAVTVAWAVPLLAGVAWLVRRSDR
jgi:ABC-2 type transport system permease protein